MLPNFERRDYKTGVWFANEILNALAAVDAANFDVAGSVNTPEARLYRRGFEAAIGAMARAFGLAYYPPPPGGRMTP